MTLFLLDAIETTDNFFLFFIIDINRDTLPTSTCIPAHRNIPVKHGNIGMQTPKMSSIRHLWSSNITQNSLCPQRIQIRSDPNICSKLEVDYRNPSNRICSTQQSSEKVRNNSIHIIISRNNHKRWRRANTLVVCKHLRTPNSMTFLPSGSHDHQRAKTVQTEIPGRHIYRTLSQKCRIFQAATGAPQQLFNDTFVDTNGDLYMKIQGSFDSMNHK